MPFRANHLSHFKTLASIRVPRVTRALAWMLVATIVGCILFMIFVPWVQTAPGTGAVIALDPRDRVQNITALVPGRIEQWYVTDGSLVKRGDPIARISDNDPNLLDRLRAERAQADVEIMAAQQAMRVAQLDVSRLETLYREGLAPRRDYELAQIKVSDYAAKVAQARAERTRVDVSLNRQSVQMIRAPRAGRVLRIQGGDNATMVSAGDIVATFAPEQSQRVVELYVDGRDVPLIEIGRRVRLEFEGWPAIQFSGWPSVAQGMFDGKVRAIDVSASANGLFRVIVEPAADRPAWPQEPYVRLGAKVRGWVLMDTVSVGFELWRQLNDFPLQFQRPGNVPDASATNATDANANSNAK
ncbi:MAG: efflux RND transporter periplasmic adaptor subunit [Alphaproteobacteria bacterium]